MTWVVQHQPHNQPSEYEAYDTEPAAESRAEWLVKGKRVQRVVVFEIDTEGEQ
jgi:hypothetical protein